MTNSPSVEWHLLTQDFDKKPVDPDRIWKNTGPCRSWPWNAGVQDPLAGRPGLDPRYPRYPRHCEVPTKKTLIPSLKHISKTSTMFLLGDETTLWSIEWQVWKIFRGWGYYSHYSLSIVYIYMIILYLVIVISSLYPQYIPIFCAIVPQFCCSVSKASPTVGPVIHRYVHTSSLDHSAKNCFPVYISKKNHHILQYVYIYNMILDDIDIKNNYTFSLKWSQSNRGLRSNEATVIGPPPDVASSHRSEDAAASSMTCVDSATGYPLGSSRNIHGMIDIDDPLVN